MKPGHYWHPEKRRWCPVVVKGATTGPATIPPACAECSSPPFEHCKCWPEVRAGAKLSRRRDISTDANAMPSHSDRINAEDEQLALFEATA